MILSDPALHERFSSNARERVIKEFSFEKFVDEHRRIYRE